MLPKEKSRWFNSTLINLHAPTNDNSEEVKNEFYDNLEQVVDKLNNYEIKILLGDCNAKIGKEPIFSPTIGLESLHEKSNYNATCLTHWRPTALNPAHPLWTGLLNPQPYNSVVPYESL